MHAEKPENHTNTYKLLFRLVISQGLSEFANQSLILQ